MPQSNNRQSSAPSQSALNHIPPHSPEMEQSVLGSLMVDPSCYDLIAEILSPDSFYDSKHQVIYEAIRDLSNADQPFDILAVKDRLEKSGNFQKAGQMAYLAELVRKTEGSFNIQYYAKTIAEKYVRRQLITSTSEVQTGAFDDTIDSDSLLQKAQADLYKISQKSQHTDFTQINPVIDEVLISIKEAAKQKGGLSGIPTLFHDLDRMTSGWQNSDLIIIAARPAMGKTAFALSMARNIAVDQRMPLAFFSLEMSNAQLVKRMVSNVCEIGADKLRSGQLKPYEWTQLDTKIQKLHDAPLFVDDTSSLSIFELRTKARRLVQNHGVRIIMIDYLQLMTASGIRFGSRQEEVSHISRNLKSLAKELNIPIIALSQLNRGVEKREGEEAKRPQLSDLRESGAIEQDADMVCFIHRPEYYKIYASEDAKIDYRGKAEFIIGKHRNGEVGIVYLRFKPELTRFANPDDDIYTGGSISTDNPNDSSATDSNTAGSSNAQGAQNISMGGNGYELPPQATDMLPPELGGGSMPSANDPFGGQTDIGSAPF